MLQRLKLNAKHMLHFHNVFGRSDLEWKEREGKEIGWKEMEFGCLVEVKKREGDLE